MIFIAVLTAHTERPPLLQVHAVNFWGHAYLTLLLLGRLIQAGPARIVQVVRAHAWHDLVEGRVPLARVRVSWLGGVQAKSSLQKHTTPHASP